MSSVFVSFAPSVSGPFIFQPVIGGVNYNAVITWNLFGERFYLNLYDQGGNLLLCTAMVASGPRFSATFTWSANVATAVMQSPHNVPIGGLVQVRMSETDSSFDGTVQALAINATTLTYALSGNPDVATPATGIVDFALNLVATLNIGWLLFHLDTMQFEYEAAA